MIKRQADPVTDEFLKAVTRKITQSPTNFSVNTGLNKYKKQFSSSDPSVFGEAPKVIQLIFGPICPHFLPLNITENLAENIPDPPEVQKKRTHAMFLCDTT
jgi:hypothetical protein